MSKCHIVGNHMSRLICIVSSDIQHGTYRDIAVKFVSFNATLSNSANVKIHVYLIDGYGIINNGDEAIAVMPGRC